MADTQADTQNVENAEVKAESKKENWFVSDEPHKNPPAKSGRKTGRKTAKKKKKVTLVEGEVTYGMAKQARELDRLTKEIGKKLSAERKIWMQTFLLMEEVSDKHLFKARGFSSFTKWLNYVARNEFDVNPSLLWKRLKAGRFQARYMERQKKNGTFTEADEHLDISPDTLVLIEKVADGDEHQEDALMKTYEDGNLTSSSLKNAYWLARADKIEKGKKAARVNAYDDGKGRENSSEFGITAAQVSLLLADYETWFPRFLRVKNQLEAAPELSKKGKAKYATEFPVETGETAHARRLDGLMLETFSVNEHDYDTVMLHGFEIKVSKNDLVNDKKMGDYVPFVDYFAVVVPQELFETACEIIPHEWGIYTIDKSGDGTLFVNVARVSSYEKATMRDLTLMRYIRKYSLK